MYGAGQPTVTHILPAEGANEIHCGVQDPEGLIDRFRI